jgi:hypothetical protein
VHCKALITDVGDVVDVSFKLETVEKIVDVKVGIISEYGDEWKDAFPSSSTTDGAPNTSASLLSSYAAADKIEWGDESQEKVDNFHCFNVTPNMSGTPEAHLCLSKDAEPLSGFVVTGLTRGADEYAGKPVICE